MNDAIEAWRQATGVGMRRHFPIFASVPGPFHYLDSAATGQICQPAADALWRYETGGRANVKRGVYRLADQATQAFDGARATIAGYLGTTDPAEIVFTSGSTAALNIAAHGLADRLRAGDEVLVSQLEHHSNIVPWQLAAHRRGAVVKALEVGDDGRLDLEHLAAQITDRTRIVAVTHVSNVTGAYSELARIAELAHARGALLVVDGAQRAAHGPINVPATGADFYAFSSHKMFGPTGAGVLWGRKALLDEMPPFLGGGEMIREVRINGSTFAAVPHRFEAGTPPIGAVLGMAAAARFLAGLDWAALNAHEQRLTGRTLEGLAGIDGVRIIGPQSVEKRAGIVAFEVADVHAHDVCQMLDTFGIALRGGHHCAQPLMERFDVVATARASLAPYSDDDDIDALLRGLEQVVARLR